MEYILKELSVVSREHIEIFIKYVLYTYIT